MLGGGKGEIVWRGGYRESEAPPHKSLRLTSQHSAIVFLGRCCQGKGEGNLKRGSSKGRLAAWWKGERLRGLQGRERGHNGGGGNEVPAPSPCKCSLVFRIPLQHCGFG